MVIRAFALAISTLLIALANAFASPTISLSALSRQSTRGIKVEAHQEPTDLPALGNYHALLVGINNYRQLPRLKTAVADAEAVGAILAERYGFKTKMLPDASRQQIMAALVGYWRGLGPNDNLLIYYAGHGYRDKEIDKAYWLPVDAEEDENANWISADDITTSIKGIPARHILIISDSCYSGMIYRKVEINLSTPIDRPRYLRRVVSSKSRHLLSSGSDEPVADGGGGGHSVFARALLRGFGLMDKDIFTAQDLFVEFIQESVAGRSEQLPQYSPLFNSGHDGGEFVFARKKMAETVKKPSPTPNKTSGEPPPPPIIGSNQGRDVSNIKPKASDIQPTNKQSLVTANPQPLQIPDLHLALKRAALVGQPGQAIQLPLVITNAGNKEDQFRLETDLPAEYQPTFSQSGNDSGMPIFVTPEMSRGSNLEIILNIRVPDNIADNSQQRFLVRAASQANSTIVRVADASLTVVAAALAATSDVQQETVMPGDTFTQRISVRNQGSASARGTRADFVFSPDFELVSATPAPISYDRPSRTAIWSLGDLESRDNREITVTLRAVPDALAATGRVVGRGTMRTTSLTTPSNFDGPTISVGRVARAQVESVSTGLTATPGDTIYIPFFVRNPSNYPESFEMRLTAPGAPAAIIYADLNGDGQHQDSEPQVTQTSALDPRGGQYPVLLRVDIPRSMPDRQQFAYNLLMRAVNAPGGRVVSEASIVLTIITPRVRVDAELPNLKEVKPGDTILYKLVLVNDGGGGLAKNVNVVEYLTAGLEFVSSLPELTLKDLPDGGRGLVWHVAELAPGDTQVLKVTVRLRLNLAPDAIITPRHILTYQDTNGNAYRGR
jgi:uncharacterized repeat protein (TIGR01451 family)